MSKVVELLEKLSKPKSVNMSNNFKAPKSSLDKLELYSAVCNAGKKHSIGLAIIMATEFGEKKHVKTLQDFLIDELGSKELMTVAYSELCFIPIGKNQLKIKSLLKQYGPRAKRSRRLIESWNKAIKSLSRSGRHQDMVEKLLSDITKERAALDAWADKYSRLSCNCPRCGATGHVNGETCKSCFGDRLFSNKIVDWKVHLKQLGVTLDSQTSLKIEAVISDLNAQKSLAINIMSKRARMERVN